MNNKKDDFVEPNFEPFEIDLGGKAGLPRLTATVMSEAKIAESGAIHICARVADIPPGKEYPGSTKDKCSSCGTEVWIAPSGQRIQAFGKNSIMCSDCLISMLGQAKDCE